MKKNVLVCGIFAAAMLTALAFTACEQPNDTGNDTGNPSGNPSGSVPVTGVTLDRNSIVLDMGNGNTATLTATVQPTNASNKNVNWTSSAPNIATVNNGTVTAVSAGTAMITVTTADGNKTATCSVTVGSTSGGGSGTLTINNLPEGVNYAVGVYNHSGAISDILEWATVATNIIAVGSGTASSSVTLYAANTATGFTGTGSYMVALYTASVPITVLYKTGVSFTNGNATVDYAEMTDLLGNAPGTDPGTGGETKGKLTINNLPSGNSLAITVYNYADEITNQTELTTIQADTTKLSAVSFGLATSSPASLIKSGGSTSAFDGTGTYLIVMTVNTTTVRYAEQVTFTDGCAEVNFSTLKNMSDLPSLPVANKDPIAEDFTIGNLSQTVGNVTKVTITPK
jgi:hypothetical protein